MTVCSVCASSLGQVRRGDKLRTGAHGALAGTVIRHDTAVIHLANSTSIVAVVARAALQFGLRRVLVMSDDPAAPAEIARDLGALVRAGSVMSGGGMGAQEGAHLALPSMEVATIVHGEAAVVSDPLLRVERMPAEWELGAFLFAGMSVMSRCASASELASAMATVPCAAAASAAAECERAPVAHLAARASSLPIRARTWATSS